MAFGYCNNCCNCENGHWVLQKLLQSYYWPLDIATIVAILKMALGCCNNCCNLENGPCMLQQLLQLYKLPLCIATIVVILIFDILVLHKLLQSCNWPKSIATIDAILKMASGCCNNCCNSMYGFWLLKQLLQG